MFLAFNASQAEAKTNESLKNATNDKGIFDDKLLEAHGKINALEDTLKKSKGNKY